MKLEPEKQSKWNHAGDFTTTTEPILVSEKPISGSPEIQFMKGQTRWNVINLVVATLVALCLIFAALVWWMLLSDFSMDKNLIS